MNHKQHETVGKHTQKSADEQQGASTSRKLAKALSVDTSNRAEQPEYDHREKIELVSRIFDNFRDPYSIVGVLPNDDIDKIKDRFLSKYNTLCRDPHHPGDSTRPLFQAARDRLVQAFALLVQRREDPYLTKPKIDLRKTAPCLIPFSNGGLDEQDPIRLARKVIYTTDPFECLGLSPLSSPLGIDVSFHRKASCIKRVDDVLLRCTALEHLLQARDKVIEVRKLLPSLIAKELQKLLETSEKQDSASEVESWYGRSQEFEWNDEGPSIPVRTSAANRESSCGKPQRYCATILSDMSANDGVPSRNTPHDSPSQATQSSLNLPLSEKQGVLQDSLLLGIKDNGLRPYSWEHASSSETLQSSSRPTKSMVGLELVQCLSLQRGNCVSLNENNVSPKHRLGNSLIITSEMLPSQSDSNEPSGPQRMGQHNKANHVPTVKTLKEQLIPAGYQSHHPALIEPEDVQSRLSPFAKLCRKLRI